MGEDDGTAREGGRRRHRAGVRQRKADADACLVRRWFREKMADSFVVRSFQVTGLSAEEEVEVEEEDAMLFISAPSLIVGAVVFGFGFGCMSAPKPLINPSAGSAAS